MNEQSLQEVTIKKTLKLSKQEVSKVLIFIAGMNAGKELNCEKIKQKN